MSQDKTITLYRPVGPKELALIARDWNVRDSGAGYVTRFAVRCEFVARYAVQTVGATVHQELWIPAEDLAGMNCNIVGVIEVIAEYKREQTS